MEFPVYSNATRLICIYVGLILLLPIFFVALPFVDLQARNVAVPMEIMGVIACVIGVNLLIFAGLYISMSMKVNIDLAARTFTRSAGIFGLTVYSKTYNFQDFDRISIHRAFRAGYMATFLGNNSEVVIANSSKLGDVRKTAQEAAAYANFRLSEQL